MVGYVNMAFASGFGYISIGLNIVLNLVLGVMGMAYEVVRIRKIHVRRKEVSCPRLYSLNDPEIDLNHLVDPQQYQKEQNKQHEKVKSILLKNEVIETNY